VLPSRSFIICDGMIVGSGNELPTPRIVLDILGVDPKIDPEPLMFKSVADGSKQLNYGKVYSGLYEFEGHVVPYIVVVKVGRPSERTRPGNRGKRDTQILLMRYLNRVHFDAPMCPLELEIYHQMKNVIGIDPAFYEYILMVDADTSVEPEGLNRLVSVAADDSRVIAICGETKVDNEEGSWWTMIQGASLLSLELNALAYLPRLDSVRVLHLPPPVQGLRVAVRQRDVPSGLLVSHLDARSLLTKLTPAGSSMYRIRSADKGRPLFISNRIIDEYSENRVDTLHKKNLLSLGEDRYLTTLILKHFPSFRTKFTPDAHAHTAAPERWGILLSQRRRWINSTVHNLAELVLMPELCGFCLVSRSREDACPATPLTHARSSRCASSCSSTSSARSSCPRRPSTWCTSSSSWRRARLRCRSSRSHSSAQRTACRSSSSC
jgi:chitin synthase